MLVQGTLFQLTTVSLVLRALQHQANSLQEIALLHLVTESGSDPVTSLSHFARSWIVRSQNERA